MSFLLFLGAMAASAWGWGCATRDMKEMAVENKLKHEPYDLVKHFEDILVHSNVKRKKIDGKKYLPENGYNDCISFIERQPLTTKKDVDEFIAKYKEKRNEELKYIQEVWDREYDTLLQEYLNSTKAVSVFTFEKKFYLMDEDWVNELSNRLLNETFFGKMAVSEPKVVKNPRSTNISYINVWRIECTSYSKAWQYYKACCRKIGYPID